MIFLNNLKNLFLEQRLTWIVPARAFSYKSSIPKISFGKMLTEGNKKLMPVSIHVHHALMDGFHVGAYIDLFQQLMNTD